MGGQGWRPKKIYLPQAPLVSECFGLRVCIVDFNRPNEIHKLSINVHSFLGFICLKKKEPNEKKQKRKHDDHVTTNSKGCWNNKKLPNSQIYVIKKAFSQL